VKRGKELEKKEEEKREKRVFKRKERLRHAMDTAS